MRAMHGVRAGNVAAFQQMPDLARPHQALAAPLPPDAPVRAGFPPAPPPGWPRTTPARPVPDHPTARGRWPAGSPGPGRRLRGQARQALCQARDILFNRCPFGQFGGGGVERSGRLSQHGFDPAGVAVLELRQHRRPAADAGCAGARAVRLLHRCRCAGRPVCRPGALLGRRARGRRARPMRRRWRRVRAHVRRGVAAAGPRRARTADGPAGRWLRHRLQQYVPPRASRAPAG